MTTNLPTPPSPADEKLEALLTSHLHTTLDAQRGRALDAFRAHLAKEEPIPAPIPISRGVIPKRALWFWAGVPSLIAASLALVLTLEMVNRPQIAGPRNLVGSTKVAVSDPPITTPNKGTIVFEQTETTRDLAGGLIVLPGNTPARQVLRQGSREVNWIDPNENATYHLQEEPVENVGYTPVQPF